MLSPEQLVLMSYLKEKEVQEKARKDKANIRLAIYHDDWKDILDDKVKNEFHKENWDKLRLCLDTSHNVLKRAANECALVYKISPTRTFKNKAVGELWDRIVTNQFLQDFNEYAFLMNDMAVFCEWDEEAQLPALKWMTPADLSVIQNNRHPQRADGVIYELEYNDSQFKPQKYYVYWSATENRIYDREWNPVPTKEITPEMSEETKRMIDEGENPYGRLPFEFIHMKRLGGSNFWNDCTGNDLVECTLLNGISKTHKKHLQKYNSWKQPYMTGNQEEIKDPSKLIDPATILTNADPQGAVGILDIQADFISFDTSIKTDVNDCLSIYGLSTDMFAVSPQEASGKALNVKNRRLYEIRDKQLPIFRDFEARLKNLIVSVWNYHMAGQQLNPDDDMTIDFAEMDIYVDPIEKRKLAKMDLDNNLISPGRFYMMFNADVTSEKEAEEKMMENANKTKQLKGAGVNIWDKLGFNNNQEIDKEGNGPERV